MSTNTITDWNGDEVILSVGAGFGVVPAQCSDENGAPVQTIAFVGNDGKVFLPEDRQRPPGTLFLSDGALDPRHPWVEATTGASALVVDSVPRLAAP